jgi:hypothetical protein
MLTLTDYISHSLFYLNFILYFIFIISFSTLLPFLSHGEKEKAEQNITNPESKTTAIE